MTAITIAAIFDNKLSPTVKRLPLADELALITAAQSGDSSAYESLLLQYAHALRGLAQAEFNRAGGAVDPDETRSNVILAFAEALHQCDGTTRLAARLKSAVLSTADEYHIIGAFSIPERTRQRYFQALREAGPDGDPIAKAIELGMSPETFTAIRHAVGTGSIEYLTASHAHKSGGTADAPTAGNNWDSEPAWSELQREQGYATVDERHDIARAFAAVDELTAGIIEDAYGFAFYETAEPVGPGETPDRDVDPHAGYDPIPDLQIAYLRGLSRSGVQRKRTEGLSTMRAALGA